MKGIRITLAALAFTMALLCGSREILVAFVVVAAIAVGLQIKHSTFRVWLRGPGKTVISLLIVGILAATLFVSVGGGGTAKRLVETVSTATEGSTESTASSSTPARSEASELTTGRTDLWIYSLRTIKKHPFGTGQPFKAIKKRNHAHNDILNRLVTGGPLSLFCYLALIFWLLFCVTTPAAERFGFNVGIVTFVVGLLDGVIVIAAWVPLAFFILGMLVSPEWLYGKVPFLRNRAVPVEEGEAS
jgi:O-antigen ligase